MLHCSYIPSTPLSDFIEDFWVYADYTPPHVKERILPSGTVELVINMGDNELRIYDRVRPGVCERFSGAIVSGPYDRFFVIDTAEEASVLGVHFKPGGAFPFFGLPVSELANTHVDLETLWGRSGRQLRERLLAATSLVDTFRILEAALLGRLSGPRMPRAAVRSAIDALSRPDPTSVRDVTERVGLSHRRFVEVFKTEVGLTPKRFHRVQRLQRMLALVQRVVTPDWSRLAMDGGFFDQSHLIHEVVTFSGLSPARFARHLHELKQRGVHLKRNHLPLGA
jgi:AraC-like DNA-binding protein